jgi:hypothetical protein
VPIYLFAICQEDALIKCDAGSSPPLRVANPSKISMFVGNPPRELMVFTGTALVDWESKEKLDHNEVQVLLPGLSTPVFQWTSTVSLASITNTDSDMIFAADESWVIQGPTGLELHVNIGVMGDDSTLNRISYHVQVLTDPVTAKISGTIRWNRSLGEPTAAARKGGVNMFRVAAGNLVSVPGSGGPFGSTKWVEAAATLTTAAPVQSGALWAVPYVLENVPLSEQFTIVPALMAGVSVPNPAFTPAPRFVELTPATPTATGVDFEMVAGSVVR